jgi:hypothetical protein
MCANLVWKKTFSILRNFSRKSRNVFFIKNHREITLCKRSHRQKRVKYTSSHIVRSIRSLGLELDLFEIYNLLLPLNIL